MREDWLHLQTLAPTIAHVTAAEHSSRNDVSLTRYAEVPGLVVATDCISTDVEQELLGHINHIANVWDVDRDGRRVQIFGYVQRQCMHRQRWTVVECDASPTTQIQLLASYLASKP
jgi:hypothetical protein